MLSEKDLKVLYPYMNNIVNIEMKEYPNGEKEAILEYSNGQKYTKSITSNKAPVKAGLSSIIEHFSRGSYGDPSYRGNCSGMIVKDIYEYFKPKKVLDPMCGSNTSGEVAKELGINQVSLDLNPKFGGFNILKNNFEQSFDLIFCHFPYFVFPGSKMPVYSGIMWGSPNPYDLSRINDESKFTTAINLAQSKMYQALRKGGRLVMLIGDSRFHKKYYSMFKSMDFYGDIESVMIKRQYNYCSSRTSYSCSFLPIEHEYVVILRKNEEYIIKCIHVTRINKSIMNCKKVTWRSLIQSVIEHLGGKASRKQIYEELRNHPKAENNNFLKEKIRQVTNTCMDFVVNNNCVSLADIEI